MDDIGRKEPGFFAKVLGLGKKQTQDADEVLEEKIRTLVAEGEEQGYFEQQERQMIHNIFDFDDRTAVDLMTHRTEVIAIEKGAKISDIVFHAINDGFSRIPVYDGDIDNIKGVIYVKDLLCLIGCQDADDFQVADFVRETIYVPEAMKCADLFRRFKKEKIHLAVVVDDWGGTAGIVTMEDILESIVGNIQDEYDDEGEPIIVLDEGGFLLDGAADLQEVCRALSITPPEEDEDASDTIGGLIIDELGRIPDAGETPTIEAFGYAFRVLSVEDRRIVKVRADRLPKAAEEHS